MGAQLLAFGLWCAWRAQLVAIYSNCMLFLTMLPVPVRTQVNKFGSECQRHPALLLASACRDYSSILCTDEGSATYFGNVYASADLQKDNVLELKWCLLGFADDVEDTPGAPSTSGRGAEPSWHKDLERAGFKLASSGGLTFLEKAMNSPQSSSGSTSAPKSRRATSSAAASASAAAAEEAAAPAAGLKPLNAAIVDEFDVDRWQKLAEAVSISDPKPDTAVWWLPEGKTDQSGEAAGGSGGRPFPPLMSWPNALRFLCRSVPSERVLLLWKLILYRMCRRGGLQPRVSGDEAIARL